MDNRGVNSSFDLGEGIFESLVTNHLADRLQSMTGYNQSVVSVDTENAPGELARFLGHAIEKRLGQLEPD